MNSRPMGFCAQALASSLFGGGRIGWGRKPLWGLGQGVWTYVCTAQLIYEGLPADLTFKPYQFPYLRGVRSFGFANL